MVDTLYLKYGSRLTTGTSEILYDALLADEELRSFFVNVDMENLRIHMADFLASITGGTDIYRGRSLEEAHADFNISEAHFVRVAQHLSNALDEIGIEPADKNALMSAVGELAVDIINR